MDNYENPIPGKIYISPRLKSFHDEEGKVRIVSKVIESPDVFAFGKVKNELILRHHENGKTHIRATVIEEPRGITVLNIQGWSIATDKPHNASFSFIGEEIGLLHEFVEQILEVEFSTLGAINIKDEDLKQLILNDRQAKRLFAENQELLSSLAKSEITKEDVVALGYRKKQLSVFDRLLSDSKYFENLRKKKGTTAEGLWQQFFEKNQWIFGYSLSYVHLSELDDRKLEQLVEGYSINSHGKRVDGLMKSKGFISSLCFVEIKTHNTELLAGKPYRSGCWSVSKEVSGAISQVQGTVASAIDNISTKLIPSSTEGNPTGEQLFNYQPKSFLVVGNLNQFVTEHGINEEKFRSFELFRRNTQSPEIITYDELYERAQFIVHAQEN